MVTVEVGMKYRLSEAHHATRMRAHLGPFLIGILVLLFLTFFSSACSNEKSKKPVSAPIPVTPLSFTFIWKQLGTS